MITATDFVLKIEYPPGDASLDDAVQGILFLSTSLGSTIGENDGRTVVESYFATALDRDAAAAMLQGLRVSLSPEQRPHTDWLNVYRQSLTPLPIGKRIVVVPDASIEGDPSRLRIVIPQERAFGTGSHESTALCIELIEELNPAGKRCLDVGTGSGILAIVMSRLGAREVFAFDVDIETYGVVQRNIARNETPDVRMFYGQPDAVRGQFDLIAMNIIPEVIGPLLPDVKEMMSADSRLIISGITHDRRDELHRIASDVGLAPAAEKTKHEWWAAALRLA